MLGSIQRQVMTVVDEVEREEGEKEDENMKLEGRGRGEGSVAIEKERGNICALNYFTDLVDRYGL